jgi:histidinol dehydrogenase
VLIVADDGASSEYVVGEMLAAAERAGIARVAVISESRSLLEAVAQLIDTLDLESAERSASVREAIAGNARLIAVRSRAELFTLLDRFAPAYLCLQVRDAWSYLERIANAGTILIGDSTPLVSGEYLAGTNAVAPAGGSARFSSSLSLADFTRSFSAVENSAERLTADALLLAAMAERDGFPHHAQTARMRQDR